MRVESQSDASKQPKKSKNKGKKTDDREAENRVTQKRSYTLKHRVTLVKNADFQTKKEKCSTVRDYYIMTSKEAYIS